MQIVSTPGYLEARQRLLEKEKELTRARDALNKERQTLPAVKVIKTYKFTSLDASGEKMERSLQDLFEGRSQLLVYYFMFEPSADAGCPTCSFTIDSVSVLQHLNSRSVSFVCVSRAPIDKIDAYKRRMGYTFPWVSSYASDFNHDHQPTMLEDDEKASSTVQGKEKTLQEAMPWFTKGEKQGISCFIMGNNKEGIGEDGSVYHTYSTAGRGIEPMLSTYGLLDMTKLGRRDDLGGSRGPFRRRDEYDEMQLKGIWS